MSERDITGRFGKGNKGGPGRPRRSVEAEYLSIVSGVVTLERWQKVVEAAAKLAEQGDDKARSWLAGFLLGAGRPSLSELARLDVLGVTTDDLIAAQAVRDSRSQIDTLMAMEETTALHTALVTARNTSR